MVRAAPAVRPVVCGSHGVGIGAGVEPHLRPRDEKRGRILRLTAVDRVTRASPYRIVVPKGHVHQLWLRAGRRALAANRVMAMVEAKAKRAKLTSTEGYPPS